MLYYEPKYSIDHLFPKDRFRLLKIIGILSLITVVVFQSFWINDLIETRDRYDKSLGNTYRIEFIIQQQNKSFSDANKTLFFENQELRRQMAILDKEMLF